MLSIIRAGRAPPPGVEMQTTGYREMQKWRIRPNSRALVAHHDPDEYPLVFPVMAGAIIRADYQVSSRGGLTRAIPRNCMMLRRPHARTFQATGDGSRPCTEVCRRAPRRSQRGLDALVCTPFERRDRHFAAPAGRPTRRHACRCATRAKSPRPGRHMARIRGRRSGNPGRLGN